MANQQKNHKISNFSATLMIMVAIFFDALNALVNLIPGLGQILSVGITIFAYLIFFFWFMLKGVKLMTAKKITAMGGGLLVEIMPIVNILPAIILSVAITIILDRKELGSVARVVEKSPNISMLK